MNTHRHVDIEEHVELDKGCEYQEDAVDKKTCDTEPAIQFELVRRKHDVKYN